MDSRFSLSETRNCTRMLDLVPLVGLFAEVGRTTLRVAQFRPLAAVLDKPVVRKLHGAGHEFCWSPEAQLGERKHEGWELVIECDAVGRSTIFVDRKEKLVLLHRKIDGPRHYFFQTAKPPSLGFEGFALSQSSH